MVLAVCHGNTLDGFSGRPADPDEVFFSDVPLVFKSHGSLVYIPPA